MNEDEVLCPRQETDVNMDQSPPLSPPRSPAGDSGNTLPEPENYDEPIPEIAAGIYEEVNSNIMKSCQRKRLYVNIQ